MIPPDSLSLFSLLPSIALGVALAASAGLRAWLPLLVTGALARIGMVPLGESFMFLASTPAIALFATATAIELVADKIPALDHALDAASSVVRPAAGVVLAASVLWQMDPLWASVLGIVIGGPAAAVPHVVKSVVRLSSTATTGGLANPVLSTAEDVVAAAVIALGVLVPLFAALVIVLGGIAAVRVLRRLRMRPTPPAS